MYCYTWETLLLWKMKKTKTLSALIARQVGFFEFFNEKHLNNIDPIFSCTWDLNIHSRLHNNTCNARGTPGSWHEWSGEGTHSPTNHSHAFSPEVSLQQTVHHGGNNQSKRLPGKTSVRQVRFNHVAEDFKDNSLNPKQIPGSPIADLLEIVKNSHHTKV